MSVEGIDTARYEIYKDWAQVRKSPLSQFIIHKTTEGTTWLDPTWTSVRDNSLFYNIPLGAFHFYRYGLPPLTQATWFVKNIGSSVVKRWADIETAVAVMLVGEENISQLQGQSDPDIWRAAVSNYCASKKVSSQRSLSADIASLEAKISSLAGDAQIFMDAVDAKGMYSSPAFIKAYFSGCDWLIDYDLWIANIGVTTPYIPEPWSRYGAWGVNPHVPLWQYRWDLIVPGIDGACDANHWSDAAGDMYAYFGNGKPYQEEVIKMPEYVYSKYSNLRIRSAVWGAVVGYTSDIALAFKVLEQVKEANGNIWYRIGRSRWIMGYYAAENKWYCEAIS